MPQSTNNTPSDLVDEIIALLLRLPTEVGLNDRIITAIKMCIMAGVDTKKHIIGVLMKVGFQNRQGAAVLDRNTGGWPAGFHWMLGADGRYKVHEEPGT